MLPLHSVATLFKAHIHSSAHTFTDPNERIRNAGENLKPTFTSYDLNCTNTVCWQLFWNFVTATLVHMFICLAHTSSKQLFQFFQFFHQHQHSIQTSLHLVDVRDAWQEALDFAFIVGNARIWFWLLNSSFVISHFHFLQFSFFSCYVYMSVLDKDPTGLKVLAYQNKFKR